MADAWAHGDSDCAQGKRRRGAARPTCWYGLDWIWAKGASALALWEQRGEGEAELGFPSVSWATGSESGRRGPAGLRRRNKVERAKTR